jgi:N-acetylmuramoyl-L-alanine amidase
MLRPYLPLLALLLTFSLRAVAGTQVGDWMLYKLEGRDYVTLDNVSDFYGLTGVQKTGNNDFLIRAGSRSLRGAVNSVEFFINNLKFNLSYPVVEHDGHLCMSRMDLTKVVEPVMRPGKIKNAEKINTIILDAGHGGHDNGAWSPFGWEKQFSLDVVFRAQKLFKEAGFKVVLTRSTDDFISLHERTEIANRYDNAIFIAVHFNSGGAGTGLETYTLAPRGVPSMMADGPRISDLELCSGNAHDAENIALATATHAALVVKSKLFDRGIKRARFVVIRDINIPGVLIEGGFLSNSYDAKVIATAEYRQQMAASIVNAVNNYRRATAPKTTEVVQTTPRVHTTPTPGTESDAPAETTPEPTPEPTVKTSSSN